MRHTQVASKALKLAVEPSRQPYICRNCARQFSSTPNHAADKSFWQTMRENMFGTKESERAQASRQEKQQKKLGEIAKHGQKEVVQTRDAKGRIYEVARIVDPSVNTDYTPAKTWAGLERVGSEKWVRQRADRGEQYAGFMTPKKAQLTNEEWQKLLHHVAVEALVLQKAGRNVLEICNPRNQGAASWQLTTNAAITPVNGVPELGSWTQMQQQDVLNAILQETEETTGVSADALQQELQGAISPDAGLPYADGKIGWMHISLQDPTLKLAILKRTMQLTGKRIPDPAISNAKTLADLYNAFKEKEKIAQLAKDPRIQQLAEELANVKVHTMRRTPVHKEREIGRWKIIQDELRLRDLPIFNKDSKYSKEDKEYESWKGFETKRGKAARADSRKGL